jgi:alpha-beta hydrolase superfamily lysophospholipase
MEHVTSDDGTTIAYDVAGSGPALILVGGGLDDGSENAPLVPALAASFTVYNYARRGRGESGDTPPYQVSRETEDLAALVVRAGGSAYLYGVSSGGALVLEAAAAGIPTARLAVYEVPYNLDPDWPARWRAYTDAVAAAIADGRRGDALEAFMRVTGSPDAEIEGVRSSPYWPAMESLAHTLAYDAACLGNGHPPTDRLARIPEPTLVATGDAAHLPDAPEWVRALAPAADATAAAIPHAERQTFEGQSHVADPEAVTPRLTRFFLG